jgi:hypothetical protein
VRLPIFDPLKAGAALKVFSLPNQWAARSGFGLLYS